MNEINALCQKYGLAPDELAALLAEADASRGLLGPADVEAGLASVLSVYLHALTSTAERIESPAERLVVDRFMSMAMEALHAQLQGAGSIRN